MMDKCPKKASMKPSSRSRSNSRSGKSDTLNRFASTNLRKSHRKLLQKTKPLLRAKVAVKRGQEKLPLSTKQTKQPATTIKTANRMS